MKRKVTPPDSQWVMEGWTEEKTTGRMFSCMSCAEIGEKVKNTTLKNLFTKITK